MLCPFGCVLRQSKQEVFGGGFQNRVRFCTPFPGMTLSPCSCAVWVCCRHAAGPHAGCGALHAHARTFGHLPPTSRPSGAELKSITWALTESRKVMGSLRCVLHGIWSYLGCSCIHALLQPRSVVLAETGGTSSTGAPSGIRTK